MLYVIYITALKRPTVTVVIMTILSKSVNIIDDFHGKTKIRMPTTW